MRIIFTLSFSIEKRPAEGTRIPVLLQLFFEFFIRKRAQLLFIRIPLAFFHIRDLSPGSLHNLIAFVAAIFRTVHQRIWIVIAGHPPSAQTANFRRPRILLRRIHRRSPLSRSLEENDVCKACKTSDNHDIQQPDRDIKLVIDLFFKISIVLLFDNLIDQRIIDRLLFLRQRISLLVSGIGRPVYFFF